MRRMTRGLAATGMSAVLALMAATPAAAVPSPRKEQWWFQVWDVENSVWPTTKGAGVTVAVIDSGVNASLPDLQGAVVPGKAIPESTGSENGMKDLDNEKGGHGTRMAALIASRGSGTGFVGLAPEAKVMPINSQAGSMPEAIRYAADHGAKVINISQGFTGEDGKCPDDLQAAIAYGIQKNVVIVASAGNDGDGANKPESPAACVGVVAVGALDITKKPWTSTQRQPYVSVAAPGYMVGSISKDGTFSTAFAGTSQASALTSAVAALIRSKYPQMSAREVMQRIVATAKDIGPRGKDDQTGYGVVIASAALNADVPANAPNPVYDKYRAWAASHPNANAPKKSEPVQKSDDTKAGENSQKNTLILLGGAAVVALIIGAVTIIVMRRGRQGTPAGGSVPRQPGAPSGPPPGWGGPPQGPYPGQQNPQQYTPPAGPPGGPQPPYGPR